MLELAQVAQNSGGELRGLEGHLLAARAHHKVPQADRILAGAAQPPP
ncbi:hypothetical protein ACFWP5_42475 [Streptomyces sp. NPDC058469]